MSLDVAIWISIFNLIIAVTSAILAVRLALRRFYSEKWWERKSAAYSAVLESVHHIREQAVTELAFHRTIGQPGRTDLPTDGAARLALKLQEAMAALRMHRDIGSFVISDATCVVIDTLFQELDRSAALGSTTEPGKDSYRSYLEHRIAAVDGSREQVRRLARADLSLT